jgi:hypothetical protein
MSGMRDSSKYQSKNDGGSDPSKNLKKEGGSDLHY